MPKNTMPRRKTQPRTLQEQLLSLLSDASLDPKVREGVERMSAIYAATDGSNFAAVVKMLEGMDLRIEETRNKAIASASNSVLIREFFERQDRKLDALASLPAEVGAVSAKQDALREEFSAVAENVSEIVERVNTIEEWRQEVDTDRESFRQSRAHSIEQRNQLQAGQDKLQAGQDELRQNQDTMAATLARIEEAILKPEERERLRRLLDRAGE